MTVSRFKTGYVFWFFLMLLLTIILTLFLFKGLSHFRINGLWTTTWTATVIIIIIMTVLIVLKDFKIIYLDNAKRRIKWFSIFAPFGSCVSLTEYIGVIKSSEYSSQGSYQTAYLVDRNRMTRFKINGLFYKNFDDLFDAINLKEIKKYEMSFGKYMLLLFIGRVKV